LGFPHYFAAFFIGLREKRSLKTRIQPSSGKVSGTLSRLAAK
jgi:hypothetical protein